MNVKLPILFNNDSTDQLEELNINFNLKDYDVREMTFYCINGIAPYVEHGKDYTMVYSNGFDFICPLKMSEVERLIQENKSIYAN